MEPVDCLSAGLDDVVAVLDERTQDGDRLIDRGSVEVDRGEGRDADRGGIGIVGLASVPVDSIRTRAASLAGTSTATSWSAASQRFRGAPSPLATSIAQVAAGHWAANLRRLR